MTVLFRTRPRLIEGEQVATCYMQVEKDGEKFILYQVIVDDGEESEFELESHVDLASVLIPSQTGQRSN